MMGLRLPELLVILVIVVLVFGIGRVGKIGRELGVSISEFRKGLQSDDPKTEGESESTETKSA